MLTIELKGINTPFIIGSWNKKDFDKPLDLDKKDYRVRLLLSYVDFLMSKSKINLLVFGVMYIYIDNPSEKLLAGLKNSNYEDSLYAANFIFDIYKNSMREITSYARYSLNLQNMFQSDSTFRELFGSGGLSMSSVFWKLDSNELNSFKCDYKGVQNTHPELKPEKLLTPTAWRKLQAFSKKAPHLLKEVEDLLALKQKALWNEKRIAAIESAILIEFFVGKKVELVLDAQGISKNKIKDIKKELGMSLFINLLIPLSISPKEYKTQKENLERIDKLRKVRNEIIHDGLEENQIEPEVVSEGIDAAIKLLSFLNKKFG
jgi:hypothetical protein